MMKQKPVSQAGMVALAIAAAGLLGPPGAGAGPLSGVSATPGDRPSLPVEGMITNPDWAQRPSAEDVSRFYPPLAQVMNLSGRSEIGCTVTAMGSLADCGVVREIPTGFGFGQAALQLANLFRMKPQTFNGQPTGGGGVRIPIHFQMAVVADPSAGPVPPPGPAPAAAALASANRIVAATMTEAHTQEMVKTTLDRWRQSLGDDSLTPEQRMALDIYQQGYVEAADAVRARSADRLARSVSQDKLIQIASFLESPAGRAWLETSRTSSLAEINDAAAIQQRVGLLTRDRLCRKITCLADVPASSPPAPK